MALNTYAEEFSPGREDRAVLSLNALLGAGTALAPLLVAIFTDLGAWWLLPLTVAAALAGLLLFSARQPLVASAGGATGAARSQHLPRRFWLFAAAVLLYGIAETLNGNWSGPYLTGERGVSAGGASFALTAFWAMVTIGRILFAALSSKTTVRWIYAGLPVLLIVAFQAILRVRGETGGIVAFGLAGLGCSAFFPLCISLSGQEFPRFAAAMSGELVAFYQAGYGVAAFGVGPLRDLTGRPLGSIYTVRLAGRRRHADGRARRGCPRAEGSRVTSAMLFFGDYSKTPAHAASSPMPGSAMNRRGNFPCISPPPEICAFRTVPLHARCCLGSATGSRARAGKPPLVWSIEQPLDVSGGRAARRRRSDIWRSDAGINENLPHNLRPAIVVGKQSRTPHRAEGTHRNLVPHRLWIRVA